MEFKRYIVRTVLAIAFGFTSNAFAFSECSWLFSPTAYDKYRYLEAERQKALDTNGENLPVHKAAGSDTNIVKSFEKEGLYYEDIAEWFPILKPSGKALLRQLPEDQKNILLKWMDHIDLTLYPDGTNRTSWRKLDPKDKFKLLLSQEDPFIYLSVANRSWLFENEMLTFDHLERGPNAPPGLKVADDLGSYEISTVLGQNDPRAYYKLRGTVEEYLDSKIGHQHLFHGWPKDDIARAKMAPQYIELLDSLTWYLFWRQMKRNPEDISSILSHPYLGVYTRASLARLHQAVVDNDPKKFKNKFRMVGARAFKGNLELNGTTEMLPDWEFRSGNKGVRRDFMEDSVTSRIVSGDYRGLNDYRSYQFNPSATIQEIAAPFLNAKQIDTLIEFEGLYPLMEYSTHANSNNHFRNRIVSPLLPWQNRLNLEVKADLLRTEQQRYAEALYSIAEKYNRKIQKTGLSNMDIYDLRQKALEDLETEIYLFAARVKLHEDFELYLTPKPTRLPDIRIAKESLPKDAIVDPNDIYLGFEYSFWFPVKPTKKSEAIDRIRSLAENFAREIGGRVLESEGDSHGHGIAVKFKVEDKNGEVYRFEWDGIQRSYRLGKVHQAWGGHVEVVTPKDKPQDTRIIQTLYSLVNKFGFRANRISGGAHVNFDLEALQALQPKVGTRAILNLLGFFESTKQMVMFLWTHPLRHHAAFPIDPSPELIEQAKTFSGDWKELGILLYETRYFNTYLTRKPKYTALNLTAIMTQVIPKEYIDAPALDIRHPTAKWFPNFNKVTGRAEYRLFDAPTDAYIAALQIKYVRALFNKTFNSKKAIPIAPKYSTEDVQLWKDNPNAFFAAASKHLESLGLDPVEFEPLIWESQKIQSEREPREHEYIEYEDFLPANDARLKLNFLFSPLAA